MPADSTLLARRIEVRVLAHLLHHLAALLDVVHELPPAADTLYLCVAAGVALALGALVFSAVDDRIASEA